MDDGRLRSVCAIAIEGTVSACICMGVGAEGGGGLPKETKFLPLKSESITWSHSDIISNVTEYPKHSAGYSVATFSKFRNFPSQNSPCEKQTTLDVAGCAWRMLKCTGTRGVRARVLPVKFT